MRQQLVDARGGVGLHAEEHVGGVLDGVHAVQLAGGDERVQAGQVLAGLVTQGFGLLVFLAFEIATRGLPPLTALWLPALIFPQVLLTLGVSWTLAALGYADAGWWPALVILTITTVAALGAWLTFWLDR